MVKKIIGILFFAGIGVGSFAISYYGSQLTALPTRYEGNKTKSKQRVLYFKDAETEEVTAKIQRQVEEQLEVQQDFVKVQLQEQELNELLINNIAQKTSSTEILEAATIVKPKINADEIEIGAIVNTSQLSLDNMKTHEKNFIQRAIATFPAVQERDVYIGVEGKLRAENGRLQFDNNANIKLGNVKLTIKEIADILGVPPEKIRRRLDLEMNKLNINEVELGGKGVTLKVSVD
ncbi:MAG: hypothetical protein GDA44_11395 [Prochloron sp. SP5CPC1]|nr:hypothetical protein [Candidatus Paraprochloron terpiosi SP5CPC1]